MERQLTNFRNYELSRFHPLVPGMDILPRSFGVKELPKICFEMYDGGKVGAMKRRRMLIEADPKRKEAKNKKRLAKLKRKMEAMQRKKEEAESANNAKSKEEETADAGMEGVHAEEDNDTSESRKRKRDDETEQDGDINAVKGEVVEDEEEAALLESALDKIEGAGVAQHKTREEAEIDRQKLLAGELLHDEDEDGDTKKQVRKKLTREEREAEILRRSGLIIVSDDEATVLGGNKILPWRRGYKRPVAGIKKEEPSDDTAEGGKAEDKKPQKEPETSVRVRSAIKFKTKFDVVELDASGRVIDKGDDDFMPSLKWISRKGGFEFKLGERGLGYYRTGKKVVVPSNQAYS